MVQSDLRPSDYEYALLSRHVYALQNDTATSVGTKFKTPFRTWTVCFVRHGKVSGYFGAVYECKETQQYVIVHRGTNSALDMVEDLVGVWFNRCSQQKSQALLLVDLVVKKVKKTHPNYRISFTGHSLGAFLAEISVYYVTKMLNFMHVHAVTFESPGSLESMKNFCSYQHKQLSSSAIMSSSYDMANSLGRSLLGLDPHASNADSIEDSLSKKSESTKSFLQELDIIVYLAYPNIVNICNPQSGTVYSIDVKVDPISAKVWPSCLITSHGMDGIIEWFKNQEDRSKSSSCTRLNMTAWPNSLRQARHFFKYAQLRANHHSLSVEKYLDLAILKPKRKKNCDTEEFQEWLSNQEDRFKLKFQGNFDVIRNLGNERRILPLHHFKPDLREFLLYFVEKRDFIFAKYSDKLEDVMKFQRQFWIKGFGMCHTLANQLLSFEMRKNKVSITEVHLLLGTTHDFRRELSCWLEKMGFTVDDLLDIEMIQEQFLLGGTFHRLTDNSELNADVVSVY